MITCDWSSDVCSSDLHAAQLMPRWPRRILDFGCGYGRVLRVLRAAFDDAEIMACDLDPAAVAYCAEAFGAAPLAGSANLAEIAQVREVDLVWSGSVLTHLDVPQWRALLSYVERALAPGGVAVLTTHGRRAAWRLEHVTDYGLTPQGRTLALAGYRCRGFGYNDYPGQHGYGISISAPEWVLARVLELPALRVTGFVEAGWDGHQDAVVVTRDGVEMVQADR
jgi:SAM-dependent methyltransferase